MATQGGHDAGVRNLTERSVMYGMGLVYVTRSHHISRHSRVITAPPG